MSLEGQSAIFQTWNGTEILRVHFVIGHREKGLLLHSLYLTALIGWFECVHARLVTYSEFGWTLWPLSTQGSASYHRIYHIMWNWETPPQLDFLIEKIRWWLTNGYGGTPLTKQFSHKPIYCSQVLGLLPTCWNHPLSSCTAYTAYTILYLVSCPLAGRQASSRKRENQMS